jgi:hypothetical protein
MEVSLSSCSGKFTSEESDPVPLEWEAVWVQSRSRRGGGEKCKKKYLLMLIVSLIKVCDSRASHSYILFST